MDRNSAAMVGLLPASTYVQKAVQGVSINSKEVLQRIRTFGT